MSKDPGFKEYLGKVRKLVPNLTSNEIILFRKFYNNGISPEDAVVNTFNFTSNKHTKGYIDFNNLIKYNPDFEFEDS